MPSFGFCFAEEKPGLRTTLKFRLSVQGETDGLISTITVRRPKGKIFLSFYLAELNLVKNSIVNATGAKNKKKDTKEISGIIIDCEL